MCVHEILSLVPRSFQDVSAEFQTLTQFFHRPCNGVSGNCERTEGHLDGFDGVVLLFHLRTGSETFLRQPSVMSMAHIYRHVRNMVTSADMICLKAEGTDLSRRTYPLPSAAKNSFGSAADHLSGPTLAYKFSRFKTSASFISKIAAASAKSS